MTTRLTFRLIAGILALSLACPPAYALRATNAAQSAGAEELRREFTPPTSQAGMEEGVTRREFLRAATRFAAATLIGRTVVGATVGAVVGGVVEKWRIEEYYAVLAAYGATLRQDAPGGVIGSAELRLGARQPITRPSSSGQNLVVGDLHRVHAEPGPYHYALLEVSHAGLAAEDSVLILVGAPGGSNAQQIELNGRQLRALSHGTTAYIPVRIQTPDRYTAPDVVSDLVIVVRANTQEMDAKGQAGLVRAMAFSPTAFDYFDRLKYGDPDAQPVLAEDTEEELTGPSVAQIFTTAASQLQPREIPATALNVAVGGAIVGAVAGAVGPAVIDATERLVAQTVPAPTASPLGGDREFVEFLEPKTGASALDWATYFAMNAKANPVGRNRVVVLGSSAQDQIGQQTLARLTAAFTQDRLMTLPATTDSPSEEGAVRELAVSLKTRQEQTGIVVTIFRDGTNDPVATRFEGYAGGLHLDLTPQGLTQLQLLMRTILLNLGVPESVATSERVRSFLNAAAGLEQAA